MTHTIESIGFAPSTVPNHELSIVGSQGPDQWNRTIIQVECPCGFAMQVHLHGDATVVGKRERTAWLNHLDGVSAPEEYIPIARVVKQRVSMDYAVVPSTYGDLKSYEARNWNTHEHIIKFGLWVTVVERGSGKRQIVKTAVTRAKAIEYASRTLRNLESKGVQVEWADEHTPRAAAPSFTPQASLVALVDTLDAGLASDSLEAVLSAVETADSAIAMLRVIEAKRSQLLARRSSFVRT